MDEYVDGAENMNDLYSIPWKIYLDNNKKCNRQKAKGLKVLIISAPCHGFGDIVFGMKFNKYLEDWYDCDIKIASTNPSGFVQLGEKPDNMYLLKSKSKIAQCRKIKLMKLYSLAGEKIDIPEFDLIFIAPLTADFDADYNDIKALIPYSNRLNTFFLSEYNDSIKKNIDFHTGIGSGRYGLLLTDTPEGKRLPQTKNPYSLIYIADSITRATSCYSSFIEMVIKKYYQEHTRFDIVVPEWIAGSIKKNKKLMKIAKKYYDRVEIIDKKSKHPSGNDNTLYIRGDVLPLPNADMMRLITHSVKDILLTGDQSITDALSCCSNTKNIFYQIAPWKENFGKQLAKLLPNKYLESKKTSCGTIKALKYNSKYENFNQSWDFRILARPKMDAIFLAAKRRKKNNNTGKDTRLFESLILSSKTLVSFDKKYDETYGEEESEDED